MAADYRVTLLGERAVIALLLQAERQAVPLLGRGLYEEGQLILRKSQRQVPVRFGVLKGSGRVFPPEVSGDHVEVVLGYGGAASDYAEFIHEGGHLRFRNGKKSHYLIDPMEDRVGGMDQRLLRRISRIVANG